MIQFLAWVETGQDCWGWKGHITTNGYGLHRWAPGVWEGAHRVAYELFVGPIPEGRHVHHSCGNKTCVNPAHLEVLLPSDHAKLHNPEIGDRNRDKTHCPLGHPYDEQNTKWSSKGRHCRACHRDGKNLEPTPRGKHHADKTHCPHGHEYTEENTYHLPSGGRVCRQCKRDRSVSGPKTKRVNCNSVKTHCPKGHEYTSENTLVCKGVRYCKRCNREKAAARKQRKIGSLPG